MARMLRGGSVSFACAALVVLCLLPTQIQAQVLYGSLLGNVTDPNGAVVPSASVTATNQSTGAANTTSTNASGEYNFVNLQPGTYAIKVGVSGFKTFERRNLSVEANNTSRADVALEVGNIEQSVTITGEAPALQTDRSEVHSEVSTVELENLPVPIVLCPASRRLRTPTRSRRIRRAPWSSTSTAPVTIRTTHASTA
ncbi:MAG: hypothetical protein DMG57_06170 [Acidobacteria bacterium]|nr:MAG: hypothetical protein DMG57_06170 [Acidobacteriota bacterium]